MFPYSIQFQFDKNQFGYVNIIQENSTTLKVTTKFSNGKKIDGDNFRASITMKSIDGTIVAAVDHRAGVDASFGGSANERTLYTTTTLPEEKINGITNIDVHFSHQDEVNDEVFWEKVKEVAEVVWEAYQASG